MTFTRLRPPPWPVCRGVLSRNAWKVGLGFAAAILVISRGATEAPGQPYLGGRLAAAQSVPCGLLPAGTVIWSAGTYNLPINPGNDPFPDPQKPPPCQDGVVVGPGTTLVLDAAAGPVHVSSSGSALNVAGGILETTNTDAGTSTNPSVTFEAAADVASWDGINITASGTSTGNASLTHVRIEGALRSIQISSGATSSPADSHYGLTVSDSAIGFSYFDGIDATDTPISVTSTNKGITGTINNIGSIGINAIFDSSAPAIPADALHIDGMTFGSSAPFGVNACTSNQPCYIGNQAILGTFVPNATQRVSINNSNFYRAGTYGVQLESVNRPALTGNTFICNGLGAPTTGATCTGSGPIYSAVYLNQATADLAQAPVSTGQITGNHGYGNGLDAIAFNGAVVSSTLTWQNATNASSDASNTHLLGYLLNGDLNLANGTLSIPDGSVVKTLGGTINLTHSRLDASGSNLKTFTSLRDPIGIASCPTVFAPSCGPALLPGGEWGGINLAGGSNAAINHANIFYATTGVRIASGATATLGSTSFGLTVANSTIGPTFSDGVFATNTPISVTNTTFTCPGGQCLGAANGDHGISADFTGSGQLAGGLQVKGNTMLKGSVNEAIKGTGLAGQTVDIENNTVGHAGAAGIQLAGADHLTLTSNDISDSGTRSPSNPAIYLNGVSGADFNTAITGNTGARNGLDAIALHGTTGTALTWRTIANSTSTGPLGYLVDGPLTVNGGLSLNQNDYVPSLGAITVAGGPLTATGAVVTSLKDSTVNIPTCGSVFDPKVSNACVRPAPGDWGGLTLDSGYGNSIADSSEIRYAMTGITMGKPGITAPLQLTNSNIRNTSGDAITTQSSLTISGGSFTNLGGRAISADLSATAAPSLSITGASISGTAKEGILGLGLNARTVDIATTSVDHPGAVGIKLDASTLGIDHLTLTGNTVTNTPGAFPAIYLNNLNQAFASISGNKGAGNGLNALVFHGTVSDSLTWLTARNSGSVQPLGFLLDGDLNLANTLEITAGGIVKTDGALNIGHLKADDAANASQKIITSLADDSAGVPACQSVLLPGCTGAAKGQWPGINLGSDGAIVNAAIRYAATGINIGSRVGATFGSSSFGLVVSRSVIDQIQGDAINTVGTPVSVTDSAISNVVHGINADFTGSGNHGALRLTRNHFAKTSAEAVYGLSLGGHPVWITDNRVQNAATFGIRLIASDALVLRNNNVSASGGGPAAGSGRYPAIYLSQVAADFLSDVRGNVGNGNGLDALMMNGSAIGGMRWITPNAGAATHALGYLLDGPMSIDDGTLTVGTGDIVKARGTITIRGGDLQATGATFTSLTDPTVAPVSCPSFFVTLCDHANAGDWGGLVVTQDKAGTPGTATITGSAINFADTALFADSGPIGTAGPGITLTNDTIANTQKDGINSFDTPIGVNGNTTITTAGSHGIIASFFSLPNCPSGACERLTVDHVGITGTGKDGIVANGLASQPVTINRATISNAATYGIRLVGADTLTMTNNTITGSGGTKYPAIYLSGVTGDFQGAINGNTGSTNGLNALVFHGVADNGLTWITPASSGALGYMLDGALTVNGPFTSSGVVKVLSGAIKVNGVLTSTNTAFTSMREASPGLSACDSVFLPNGCPGSVSTQDYWAGINLDPTTPSTFTGGSISDAATGLTISRGEIDMAGATLTHNGGYALQTTGTGSAMITCTGIHGNGGGILANGGPANIDNSDLYGNVSTGKDFDGTAPSTATRVWWNGAGTAGAPVPVTQYNAVTVTVDKPLPQQPPSINAAGLSNVEFSSDNTNTVNTDHFGIGTLTVKLTFDRTMDLTTSLDVKLAGGVVTVAGDWTHTDNVTWVGTALIDGLAESAGLNTLTVKHGTSCMRDGSNVMLDETAPVTLDFTEATVDDTAGASHVGATSATANGLVNANGWSKPSSNPAYDTYAFVEVEPLGTPLPDPPTVIAGATSPTALLGYTPIGHGSTNVTVSQTLTGLLPSTAYHYAVVAVDLNGIPLLSVQQFTTTGPVTNIVLSSSASSVTAGDAYPFTVTATDGTNPVADYMGTVHFDLQQADTQATLPADYTFKAYSTSSPTIPGDDGTHGFTATLKKATSQHILATDTVTTLADSLPVTVNPAALDHLTLSPDPSTVSSNTGQAYTAEARDAYENSLGDKTPATTFSITPDGTCAITPGTCSATTADTGGSHHTVTGTFNGKTGSASLVVTANAPDAPTGATASPSNGSASVAWAAPAYNGGSPITHYTVTSSPDGVTATTSDGTTLTATVAGLTNGTAYTFTVVASNAAGNSLPSAASNAVTPRTVPSKPTAVSASPGDGSAVVTWVASADTGGSPITHYTVTSSPDGVTATTSDGTTLTATVAGLTN
ncbi:MAG: fibronectin type III domain-containing protein, partial [Candidatus Dormibacter sp.]